MTYQTTGLALFVGLILLSCQSQSSYPTDPQVIARGEALFSTQCSTCHNFQSTEIGPNLSGVTTQTSKAWLVDFIRQPAAMIDGNDERATALYRQFRTYMPPFTTLPETDLEAILAFIHTYQEVPETAVAAELGPVIEDPIPDTIPPSGLVLQLRLIATAPATADKPPVARINKMMPLAEGAGREFISDLNGVLYEFRNGQFLPFLRMTDYFEHFINEPGLGTGLGSFAFHPEYAENGLFYTSHTEDPETSAPANFSFADTIPRKVRWVLSEWKQDDPEASSFSGTHRELLRMDMVTQIHGMQEIAFNPLALAGNPDYGLLYIGVGDGGSAQNGYWHLVQNKSTPWGNILCIDPAGNNSSNGQYGIPPGNPFAAEAGALGEIYAQGFRNPHRMLWDPADGKMLASDIGHRQIEELNIIENGRNYGWPEREGTFRSHKETNLDVVYALAGEDGQYTYPVIQFDHDEAGAISSGYVYHGNKIPELQGKYLFGGIVNGRVFMADAANLKIGRQAPVEELEVQLENGPPTNLRELTGSNRVDLRFGMDDQKEIYIFTKADGKIYRIVGVDVLMF